MPPLQIPSTGRRVLQTYASDKFWGATLLKEDKKKKRRIYAYTSGKFSESECHYHFTFKEIQGVKYAIKKFEFHLIGHHFKVVMDCSSFPKMLEFKGKTLPHPQLIRWKEWFSKYDFEVEHIKSDNNLIPNLLSRLTILGAMENPFNLKVLPMIYMFEPTSSNQQ